EGPREGHEAHQLRGLRRAGAGAGRAPAHLRTLGQQDREPGGGGQGRRRGGREGSPRGRQGPQDRPQHAERGRRHGAGGRAGPADRGAGGREGDGGEGQGGQGAGQGEGGRAG